MSGSVGSALPVFHKRWDIADPWLDICNVSLLHFIGTVAHGGAECSNIVSRSRGRFDTAWARGGAATALSYLVKCHQLIKYFC